jgi:Flp pilus assembly protein TadD
MSSPHRIERSAMKRTSACATAYAAACVAFVLGGCSSAPTQPEPPAESKAPAPAASTPSEAARTTPLPDASGATPAPGSAPLPPAPVPKRAQADFDRAVGLMRAGNTSEAELEFKQLATGYPQLAGPQINLGLLQRKAGRLEEAEAALKSAVERNPGSAVAWNELGVTLRMRGKFAEAADAYQHALAIDPNFAAAHRNFAVLSDLYLGDPERALTELERYKELTGEEKPVNGWIAELRQRTGKPAAPRPAPPPSQGAPAEGTPGPADAPPPQPPAQGTTEGAPASPPKEGGT